MIWGMTNLKSGERRFFGCGENQSYTNTTKVEDINEWGACRGYGHYYGDDVDSLPVSGIRADYIARLYELEKNIPYLSSATLFAEARVKTGYLLENPLYKSWNIFADKNVDNNISAWRLDNGVIVKVDVGSPLGNLWGTAYAPDGVTELFRSPFSALGSAYNISKDFAEVVFGYLAVEDKLVPNQHLLNNYFIRISKNDKKDGEIVTVVQPFSQNTYDCFIEAALYQDDTIQPAPPVKGSDPYKPIVTPDNPDAPDSSGGGGGGNKPDNPYEQKGEFNDPDDEVKDTQLPPEMFSCTKTGFLTMYAPSWVEIKALANKMWSKDFLTTLTKLLANPFEAIISLHLVPFSVNKGASQPIVIGNIDSTVNAPLVTNQYQTVDCGTVHIPIYSGTYLDYSPYTTYKITIPYFGEYTLDTDLITGQDVGLKYHVDILTGDSVAVVSVGGHDYYTFTGNLSTPLPLTQGDYTNFWRSMINTVFSTTKGLVEAKTGNVMGAVGDLGKGASSAVETVMSLKPEISSKGVIGSSFGNFCCLTPYITKTKPNLLIPNNQQKYTGWASYYTTAIGQCHGYAKFTDVILSGFAKATDNEKIAVKKMLNEGVII